MPKPRPHPVRPQPNRNQPTKNAKPGFGAVQAQRATAQLFDKGLALHQQGQFLQAQALYEQVLANDARHFDALHLLGVIAYQSRNLAQAVDLMSRALAVRPDSINAHSNIGLALHDQQQLDGALAHFDRAIALAPDFANAHYNRGNTLIALGQLQQAIASFDTALSIQPDFAQCHCNRGSVYDKWGQHEEALASYDQALAHQPHYTQAHYNRALALEKLERHAEALNSYQQATVIQPNYVQAHYQQGILLDKLLRHTEAIASFDRAIAHQPHHHEAWTLRGCAQARLLRHAEALASFDRATAIAPDYAPAYLSKSLTLLLTGAFEAAWPLYEWRWKIKQADTPRHYSQAKWLGNQDIAGKTLLLYPEQGFGDTIQFCRYARVLAQMGAKVVIEVPMPMVGLLHSLGEAATIVERGKPLPAFDLHCPLLSLPLAFMTHGKTLPGMTSYLSSQPSKREQWQQRLGPATKPRIGLAWSGSAEHQNDKNRSIPLAELARHLPTGFDYISLQKEVRPGDMAALQAHAIQHYGAHLHDFTDTAALLDQVDRVISVDTSVAHLAGALGKPTWVLLPYVPDWRWLLNRDDSPWYPSITLFRQGEDRQWATVLERVAEVLKAS